MFGAPGQSNYAAANAFLDALAHYRRGSGRPALCINWGPWAEVGMVADLDDTARGAMRGVTFLTTERGLAAFERALALDSTQTTVLRMDWDQFQAPYQGQAPTPFLQRFTKRAGAPTAHPGAAHEESTGLLTHLTDATNEERHAQLAAYLKEQLGRVLFLDPASIPDDGKFMELGLDSLMAMELIKSIEREFHIHFYPREIFDRPTVTALAAYLVGEVDRAAGGSLAPYGAAGADNAGPALTIQASALRPDSKIPGVVFLLSTPRAGSTLLRVMLAGHPQMFCPPELHLLPFGTMQERTQALGTTYLDEGVQRALMELKGLDAGASKALIQEMIDQDLSIQEVYRRLQ